MSNPVYVVLTSQSKKFLFAIDRPLKKITTNQNTVVEPIPMDTYTNNSPTKGSGFILKEQGEGLLQLRVKEFFVRLGLLVMSDATPIKSQ